MEKLILLFEEFVMKAIVLTEGVLAAPVDESKLEAFTANRDRLFQVIEKLSCDIDWQEASQDQRDTLNRQIEYIKKLDERLLVKLQEHQIEIKKDIENTHRHGESIKGYNLSNTK